MPKTLFFLRLFVFENFIENDTSRDSNTDKGQNLLDQFS